MGEGKAKHAKDLLLFPPSYDVEVNWLCRQPFLDGESLGKNNNVYKSSFEGGGEQ